MESSEELVKKAFAIEGAPFAGVHSDVDRAIEWMIALLAEGKDWAEAETQIVDLLTSLGRSKDHIKEQVSRAKTRLEPWLDH